MSLDMEIGSLAHHHAISTDYRARPDSGWFLDELKCTGVVITGEDFLRDNLADADDWQYQLGFWVIRGRMYGITFHISAAGIDLPLLIKVLRSRDMNVSIFIDNLRQEPAPEIFRRETGRGEW